MNNLFNTRHEHILITAGGEEALCA